MSLSFQAPWALAALPLAAAPWLLHRWALSRTRPLSFPSIELLRAALRASLSTSLLSHRLLLILRTALVLALVLLFSRPRITWGGEAGGGPLNLVLAVDLSASMDARVAGQSALAWAVKEALTFRPSPGSTDRVGLAAFSDRIESSLPLTGDGTRLEEALRNISVSSRPTKVETGLAAAYRMLAAAGPGEKAVLIISDGARHGWRFDSPPDGFDPAVRVALARAPTPGGNAWISSVRPASFPAEPGRLEVTGWGTPAVPRRRWTLSWNGRPAAQGVVEWNRGPSGAALPFSPTEPLAGGEMILDPDNLADDDAFYILPPDGLDLGVLVVDGAPALAPASDEVYYLDAVLEALKGAGVRRKTVTLPAMETEPLSSWDVVLLANTPALSAAAAGRLRSFIEAGGGLWSTAGDRFEAGPLASILPARPTGIVPEKSEASIPPSASGNPIGKRLQEEGGFEWSRVRVDKSLEVAPAANAAVLIASRDQHPLFVLGTYGRGRTAFLTTTIDRDWTNLPSQPIFPVLIRETLRFLAGKENGNSASLVVDQPWAGPLPAGTTRDALVERPDGTFDSPSVAAGSFRYEKTDRPGIYSLLPRRDAPPLARAAVNLDRTSGEGDLTPVTIDEAREHLPARDFFRIDPPASVRQVFDERVRGRSLSGLFSLLIGLLIAAETFVLSMRKK